MTELKLFCAAVGNTHAESVKELDRPREFESGTVTLSSTPSNDKALPLIPAVQDGPLINAPWLPFPEESEAVKPVPSSNFQ